MEMVELLPLDLPEDIEYVKSLLLEFQEKTESLIAAELLKAWPEPVKDFIKVSARFTVVIVIWITKECTESVQRHDR